MATGKFLFLKDIPKYTTPNVPSPIFLLIDLKLLEENKILLSLISLELINSDRLTSFIKKEEILFKTLFGHL